MTLRGVVLALALRSASAFIPWHRVTYSSFYHSGFCAARTQSEVLDRFLGNARVPSFGQGIHVVAQRPPVVAFRAPMALAALVDKYGRPIGGLKKDAEDDKKK